MKKSVGAKQRRPVNGTATTSSVEFKCAQNPGPAACRSSGVTSLQPQWSVQFGTRQFCAVQKLGNPLLHCISHRRKKPGNGARYQDTQSKYTRGRLVGERSSMTVWGPSGRLALLGCYKSSIVMFSASRRTLLFQQQKTSRCKYQVVT